MAKFGSYELLQKLGTGATAEVHLATGPNKAGATLFALKILLPHLSERPELRDQLLREARLASSIHHPNVAEVFDVGEAEERAYLAMEYVRGRPLSALLRALREQEGGGGLSVAEACFVVREAALGLHEAHEIADARRRPLGLVHRDVSPQNVMVREDGRIKVVDFGLAKVTSSEEAIAFTVGGPGIKGKIPYMPPEQVRNDPLDRRADVFAASAVLFELLCGRRLYPGGTEAELIQQALSLPMPDPLQFSPGLPRELVEALERGLERDLSRRTGSAAALAEALGPFVAGDTKEKLARRMERCFDPLPRTVEEARMAALAQRTSGQPLGAVRPITRSRPGADARPPTPGEQERTTLAAAFPTQSMLRTDPAGTDPSATTPHLLSDLPQIVRISSREVELPTVAEIPQGAPPPELPLIRAEVTGPVSVAARLHAVEDATTVNPVEPSTTDIRPLPPPPDATRPNPVEPSATDIRPPLRLQEPEPEPDAYSSPGSPMYTPSFTPAPETTPPPPRRPAAEPREPARSPLQWLPNLTTQQTVIVLAAVAALGGLGMGVLLKQLTADDGDSPPPARRADGSAPPGTRPGESPERARSTARPVEGPRGQVVILAEPMAIVSLNGHDLGTTPYVGEHPAGTHQFHLRAADGIGSAQLEISLQPNEQVTRRVVLR